MLDSCLGKNFSHFVMLLEEHSALFALFEMSERSECEASPLGEASRIEQR